MYQIAYIKSKAELFNISKLKTMALYHYPLGKQSKCIFTFKDLSIVIPEGCNNPLCDNTVMNKTLMSTNRISIKDKCRI